MRLGELVVRMGDIGKIRVPSPSLFVFLLFFDLLAVAVFLGPDVSGQKYGWG